MWHFILGREKCVEHLPDVHIEGMAVVRILGVLGDSI